MNTWATPNRVRLPICTFGCDDVLPRDWKVRVVSEVEVPHQLIVLDDRGRVVTRAAARFPADGSSEQLVSGWAYWLLAVAIGEGEPLPWALTLDPGAQP